LALLAGAVRAADPPPSPQEQARFLAAARRNAMDYAESLPDFLCTQRIERYSGGSARPVLRDTLTVQLGYYQGKEQYSLTAINGRRTTEPYESIAGLTNYGDFGSVLKTILGANSAAVFEFQQWTSIHGRPAAVYSYRLARADSQYGLIYGFMGETSREVVGLSGEVVLERETQAVLRLTYTADGIPDEFPVRSSRTRVSYDYVEIGDGNPHGRGVGRPYLLPSDADVEMLVRRPAAGGLARTFRSATTFRSYRKFSSDSTVHFSDELVQP
jgi:hypothetical protein